MTWDSDGLFNKAAMYFARAYSSDREGDEFPLYLTLAFEFLARAALAKVHPVLLADPQTGENLLFAFGYPVPGGGQPRSVPMKTVLHRLVVVIDEFTEQDFKFATSVIEMRNGELHSGDMPFSTFKPGVWLPDLLRVSQVFCGFLGRTLEDLLGPEDATTAQELIAGLDNSVKGGALQAVARAREAFNALDGNKQEELLESGGAEARLMQRWDDRLVACPSCGADALLRGKQLRIVETVATEEGLEEKTEMLPTSLKCFACGLQLTGHGQLHHVELGGLFTTTMMIDPTDYFGIEFDPGEYFEPEYGND